VSGIPASKTFVKFNIKCLQKSDDTIYLQLQKPIEYWILIFFTISSYVQLHGRQPIA